MAWVFKHDCNRTIKKPVEVCGMCRCLQGFLTKWGGWRIRGSALDISFDYIASQLFHEDCMKCTEIQRSSTESLCWFCGHMRLGHITRCAFEASRREIVLIDRNLNYQADEIMSPSLAVGFNLILGSISDLEERSAYCDTCRTFMNKATSIANQMKVSLDTTVELFIKFGNKRTKDFELDFIELFLKDLETPQTQYKSPKCKAPFPF